MGSTGPDHQYDVLIIGAGLSGVCALYHIKQKFPDWHVKVIDAASGVGGVWYWNSYPGARVDSESMSYCYSFDKELLDEWHWKESFSSQPEILRYINRVCEKHDLYKDIIFNTRIQSANWNEKDHTWLFRDDKGVEYRTTFYVSCVGFLSAPTWPAIPGREDFAGKSFHTSRWPKDLDFSKDFSNKHIGVIGTGATGIQTITEVAKTPNLKSLTVFQRTANWSAPLRNTPVSPEQMMELKTKYDDVFQRCLETPACFIHEADPRKSLEVSEEERLALWEKIYAEPGMSKWLGAFSDTYINREANQLYSNFIADKIRSRVHDPVVAEKLVPKSHGFGTRRVPLESGYFETYNQPNVHLVDLQETPLERITPKGIVTADGKEHELDVLIFATGFDAITGSFAAIEWNAKEGRPLIGNSGTEKGERAIWCDSRPRTLLGITVPKVPNMMMVMGPHQPFGNAPRSIEHAVDVVMDLLAFCKDNGYTYVEATEEAADLWTQHVYDCSKGALLNEVDSWMTGVNKNIDGKMVRTVARYAGNAIEFRRRCEECKASGWKGMTFAK